MYLVAHLARRKRIACASPGNHIPLTTEVEHLDRIQVRQPTSNSPGRKWLRNLVGARGFEPPTSGSRTLYR